MGNPAYVKKVKVETDVGVWTDLPTNDASLKLGGDVLDDTEMATNAGFRSRIYGLRDWSIGGNCEFVPANAALLAIKNAWLNRTVLKVQYLPDGQVANGFEGNVVVESYELGGAVADKENVGFSLQADGAIAAAA